MSFYDSEGIDRLALVLKERAAINRAESFEYATLIFTVTSLVLGIYLPEQLVLSVAILVISLSISVVLFTFLINARLDLIEVRRHVKQKS